MTPLLPIFPSSKSAEGSLLLKEPSFRAWLNRYVDKRMPGARTSAIAQTRLIDDRLREVLARGIKQVVILGAGFDCRSIRLPELRRATVFEVDHFDTLRETV
jgi:methyltransferase (TIGR00027 family)